MKPKQVYDRKRKVTIPREEPIERVDEVVGWLVEGRRYLVPTVKGEWLENHGVADWPVVGPRHKDIDLGVTISHYHIDLRFVDMKAFYADNNTAVNESCDQPIRYVEWTCLQACVVLNSVTTRADPTGLELNKRWAGRQCGGSSKTGWICPHRGIYLGSQPPSRGVITCPGHGLPIDPETGLVLPPDVAAKRSASRYSADLEATRQEMRAARRKAPDVEWALLDTDKE